MPADENLRPPGLTVEKFLKNAALIKSVYAGYDKYADIDGKHVKSRKSGTTGSIWTYISDGWGIPIVDIDVDTNSPTYGKVTRKNGHECGFSVYKETPPANKTPKSLHLFEFYISEKHGETDYYNDREYIATKHTEFDSDTTYYISGSNEDDAKCFLEATLANTDNPNALGLYVEVNKWEISKGSRFIKTDDETPVKDRKYYYTRYDATMCSDFVLQVLHTSGYKVDNVYRSLGPNNKYYNQYAYEYKNLPNYLERQGWRIITRVDDLLPGDIVFTKFNRSSKHDGNQRFNPGHTFIYVGPVYSGKAYNVNTKSWSLALSGATGVTSDIPLAYDCGNKTAVRNYDSPVNGSDYWKGKNYYGGLNECYFGVNDSDSETTVMREPTDLWDPTIYGFLGDAYDPVSEASVASQTPHDSEFNLFGWRGLNTSYLGKPLFKRLSDEILNIENANPSELGWYNCVVSSNGNDFFYILSTDTKVVSSREYFQRIDPVGLLAEMYNPKTQKYVDWMTENNKNTLPVNTTTGKLGLYTYTQTKIEYPIIQELTPADDASTNAGRRGVSIICKLQKDGALEVKIIGTSLIAYEATEKTPNLVFAKNKPYSLFNLTSRFGKNAGTILDKRSGLKTSDIRFDSYLLATNTGKRARFYIGTSGNSSMLYMVPLSDIINTDIIRVDFTTFKT
jgi:hypothetical protein